MNVRRCVGTALVVALLLPAPRAHAVGSHAPIPEPILSETVTDIDGDDAGEFELELNAVAFRARRGGAYELQSSVELEWLATRRLGLRIEPSVGRSLLSPGSATTDVGVSGGVSWKLLQDFTRDFHLHGEVLARAPWAETAGVQPGDSAAPLTIDLRAAKRAGVLTLRWSLGVGLGGDMEHAPLRASVAVLFPFERSGRFGFWGLEGDADGERRSPFLAALNIVPDLTPLGLPFRVGLAIPLAIGARETEPSLGVLLRIFYVSAHELEYGRGPTPRAPSKRDD